VNRDHPFAIRVFPYHVGKSEDRPTFRSDAARSGHTSEPIAKNPFLLWTYQQADSVRPAWPRSDRMTFDRAAEPIAAGGLVHFGSSVDGSFHALDEKTGAEKWVFPTRAPIRFAACFFRGKIYSTSDDSFLYCLNTASGPVSKQGFLIFPRELVSPVRNLFCHAQKKSSSRKRLPRLRSPILVAEKVGILLGRSPLLFGTMPTESKGKTKNKTDFW
jgi:hypothetical protein